MMKWLRKMLKRYDEWCLSLGLTPENKRSCVPYRSDPSSCLNSHKEKKRDQ
ncbi:DUF5363 family protein [Vibrio inusitatus]|uniref:DUF5363 family protein n=1 Tax=Vibrio inusitatus TaxID=413402 RepID=UPI00142ECD68|nr:DUF5363 family protein [Vibrio inusitatus]